MNEKRYRYTEADIRAICNKVYAAGQANMRDRIGLLLKSLMEAEEADDEDRASAIARAGLQVLDEPILEVKWFREQ